jgi:hypothetical protein
MQNDRWLIGTGSEQEPFSLSAGPVGFPIWIDDEAEPPRSYTQFQEEEDVTRAPTVPQQTMWQHESPDYRVESSLSSLSLVSVEDVPPVVRPPSIDELNTLPPARRRQRDEMLPARPPAHRDWPIEISKRRLASACAVMWSVAGPSKTTKALTCWSCEDWRQR